MESLDLPPAIPSNWNDLCALLPTGTEALAGKHGILKYRRAFSSVRDLIRLSFGYSLLDFSLRTLAGWASEVGICKPISDVAVYYQLSRLAPFLGDVLAAAVAERAPTSWGVGRRLVLVDGTSFGRVGSEGTEWRINVAYSASPAAVLGVSVKPAKVGEDIEASALGTGDVAIGDRHYCASGRAQKAIDKGADVLVRATRTLRLWRGGVATNALGIVRETSLAAGEILDVDVVSRRLRRNGKEVPLRLLAVRKTSESERRTTKRLQRLRSKKGGKKADSADAREAGGYIFILTTLPREVASASEVAEAYRWRWQIELAFKRWKSLIHLDELRARDKLAETYVHVKLLVAVLLDAALRDAAFSPWGSRLARPTGAVNGPRRGAKRRDRSRSGNPAASRAAAD